MFVVKDQDTLMTSLYQFTLLELVLDYGLQITVTWSSRIHVLCISFSAASLLLLIRTVCVDHQSELKNSDISRQGSGCNYP